MVAVPEWPCWHEEWEERKWCWGEYQTCLVWKNLFVRGGCFFFFIWVHLNTMCQQSEVEWFLTSVTSIRASLLRERETHAILKQIRHSLKVRISLSERKEHSRLGTLKASACRTHSGFHGNSHSLRLLSGCLGLIDFDICGSLPTKHTMVYSMALCVQPFTYHCDDKPRC